MIIGTIKKDHILRIEQCSLIKTLLTTGNAPLKTPFYKLTLPRNYASNYYVIHRQWKICLIVSNKCYLTSC